MKHRNISNSSSSVNEDNKEMIAEFSTRERELKMATGSREDIDMWDEKGTDASPLNQFSDQPPLPFQDPNQNVFVVNIAHRQQRPVSKIPAFRICGGFKDVAKLKRHVMSVGGDKAYGGATIHGVASHKKFLLCSSLEKQQNADYVMNKIEEITNLYVDMINFHNEEFESNKAMKRQGMTGLSKREKVSVSKNSTRKKLLDKKFKELESKGEETGEVMRNAEVRNQKVAVVSVMDDLTPSVLKGLEDPEPVIIIWGCFESDEKARHYILNTAQERVKDVNLDVYNMYEWAFPTEVNVEEIEEQHRDATLDKVMKSRKKQKTAVMTFEEWCKEEGKQAPALEISAYRENEDAEIKTEVKQLETLSADMTVSTGSTNDPQSFRPLKGSLKDAKYTEMVFDTEIVEEVPQKENNDEDGEK